ncbi:type II toxin-antitoxin system VapC family toxin [Sphingomonas sp. DT-204]|uniref:type II toxin-antitoxin system VapC family toxin n=1 Tax=Sphingomonas sp. DT-204 TaxID=3396166 RepID=UPI003F1D08E1
MSFLLDTHALLWWWLDDEALSTTAEEAMRQRGEPIFVSPVSAVEIAIKVRNGKLPAMRDSLLQFDELVRRDAFTHLPVTYAHACEAGLMPGEHRDPFDRLIAAQGRIERLTVITRDPQFTTFGCETLW